jgi:hypothetical protein
MYSSPLGALPITLYRVLHMTMLDRTIRTALQLVGKVFLMRSSLHTCHPDTHFGPAGHGRAGKQAEQDFHTVCIPSRLRLLVDSPDNPLSTRCSVFDVLLLVNHVDVSTVDCIVALI